MKFCILFSVLLIVAASNAVPHDEFLKYSDIESLSWFSYIKLMVKEFAHFLSSLHLKNPCRGECPEYEAINSTSEYERRCYPSYAWAGTAYEGTEMPSGEMFLRLYRYFNGNNLDEVKMKRTYPVAIKVQEATNSTKRYTMLFFIPNEYQTTPPRPNNTLVSIVRIPRICLYAKSFGGEISETVLRQNLEELEAAIKKDGIEDYIDPDTVYFYSDFNRIETPPMLRKNEIWIVQQ